MNKIKDPDSVPDSDSDLGKAAGEILDHFELEETCS